MKRKSYKAPALDKGLDILELLSTYPHGLSQAQIASSLSKSVNEIYRMLNTLKERKYLEFNPNTDQYKLSYKLLEMTSHFEPINTLMQRALPLMKEIVLKCNQSVHLSIYTSGKLLVIAQEDSPSSLNYHVAVGSTFDLLETSSGRVLLAFQSEEERRRRLERRKLFIKIEKKLLEKREIKPFSTIKDIEKKYSSKTILKIKKNGCEVMKSYRITGVTNLSFPIFDNSGFAIAAIIIPYLNRIKSKNDYSLKQTVKLLQEYSKNLSSQLGYRYKT